MSSPFAAIAASIVGGALIAVVAVVGGVSALTSKANPAAASEQVVQYDAR